jgi:hypothetical protein
MLSQQVANSDILSLLGASSKGSGIKGDVSENGLGEFAQLLKGQDEGDITQLMSRLSSPQAQEVLPVFSL